MRFIAVNDNFDSNDYIGVTSGIDIAFRNLIHQKYSQDLSDKVKSAMHMKMAKGKYVNHPPFGYMKSVTDKHSIIPDPETAPIVREIFEAILTGHSTTEIAVMLNDRQVLTPMAYKKWKERKELVGRVQLWNHRTILRIVKDLKYTGAMVNHKCENRHIRDKSQRRVPQSEWIITDGMHEGIVTKDEFQGANDAIRNVERGERKAPDPFGRVFYCGHCGRKLRKSCNINDYFACETAVYQPGAGCGDYRWNTLELENVVLTAYKGQLLLLESKLKAMHSAKGKEKSVDYVPLISRLEKELNVLNAKKLQEYEAYRTGHLSKESFLERKIKISETVERLKAEKSDVESQLAKWHQAKAENENMVETLAAMTDTADNSDDELRVQMYKDIDRVFVFSSEDIEIHLKFDDLFATDTVEQQEHELSDVV